SGPGPSPGDIGMTVRILGSSALGLPIPVFHIGSSGPKFLIMGGVHGDEREGVVAANGVLARLLAGDVPNIRAAVIPCLNPDGLLSGTRTNGNGVDLNRNLPSNDWN